LPGSRMFEGFGLPAVEYLHGDAPLTTVRTPDRANLYS
jgi:hypothetical protein